MLVDFDKANLVEKAMQQPDKVKPAPEKIGIVVPLPSVEGSFQAGAVHAAVLGRFASYILFSEMTKLIGMFLAMSGEKSV